MDRNKRTGGGRAEKKTRLILAGVAVVLAGAVAGVAFLAANPREQAQPETTEVTMAPSETVWTEPEQMDPTTAPTEEVQTEMATEQVTEPATEAATETEPAASETPKGDLVKYKDLYIPTYNYQNTVTEAATQAPKPTQPKQTQATTKPTSPIKEEIASGDITCDEFGRYSGQYVEDGRDELVENVAVARVTNRSDQFLDLATITIDISGQKATFVVTGLPAGRSAWVLEANRMTIGQTASFEFLDCATSFRPDVTAKTDRVKITSNGNMLTATNTSSQKLENVFVYYRTLHTDGAFLGGITYTVQFGDLEPGQSAEVLAGHYDAAKSEIVRIGWTKN